MGPGVGATFPVMTRVETIEKEIAQLSPQELATLREWFAEFDAATWDRQIVADSKEGKLDALADEALRDHQAGKTSGL